MVRPPINPGRIYIRLFEAQISQSRTILRLISFVINYLENLNQINHIKRGLGLNREGNLQGFGGSADINKEEKDGFRPDYHHYEHVQFVVRS